MKKFTPFFVLLLFLVSCGGNKETEENNTAFEVQKADPKYLYDICIDSLDVTEGYVKKNEFLANILQREGVNYNTVNFIDKNRRNVFDVRKIKVGNKYTFLKTRDSIPQAKYWIYEIDRINYAVFELTDSLRAWRGEKEDLIDELILAPTIIPADPAEEGE